MPLAAVMRFDPPPLSTSLSRRKRALHRQLWMLGVFRSLLFAVITLYSLVWDMLRNGSYLRTDPIDGGTVKFSVWPPTREAEHLPTSAPDLPPFDTLEYCAQSSLPASPLVAANKLECRAGDAVGDTPSPHARALPVTTHPSWFKRPNLLTRAVRAASNHPRSTSPSCASAAC